MKRTPLKRTSRLKPRGQRGKRLAPGDSEISQEFRSMVCYCGCNEEPDPCHLESRRYESTRHDRRYVIPLCRAIHQWLDQGDGVQVREQLFDLVTERINSADSEKAKKAVRLTPADVVPLLVEHGAYAFKLRRRG